jgi:hypothetical protein
MVWVTLLWDMLHVFPDVLCASAPCTLHVHVTACTRRLPGEMWREWAECVSCQIGGREAII